MFCFFCNDTATTEIYTLSLHDALPICAGDIVRFAGVGLRHVGGVALLRCADELEARLRRRAARRKGTRGHRPDRKSTRLNSSHMSISYAVFCLKKKTKKSYPISGFGIP